MNKIFDKRLYVLWSFIVLINSHFLQAQDFNGPPYFDPYSDSGVPILQPSYIIPSQIPWQDPMPYAAYQTAQGMPTIASNAMPEIMQQMRTQDPAISQQQILPWQKYALCEEQFLQHHIDSLKRQPIEPGLNDPQAFVQFWNFQHQAHNNLHNISAGCTSQRMISFFDLCLASIPCTHQKLYNQCLQKLVDRYCKKDKASKELRLTQIPHISKQEALGVFQEYLDQFPQDWRIVRYLLQESYIKKTLKDGTCRTQVGSDISNAYNHTLYRMSKRESFKEIFTDFFTSPYKNDVFMSNFYLNMVSEKFSLAHSRPSSQFKIQQDPLYHSTTRSLQNYELLLLRQEYANTFLNILAPLQEGSAIQDIFAHIPENINELVAALHNPNTYRTALDAVIDSLEQHHPECFLENGILSIFQKNPYVHYMHHDADVDKELLHIINHALAVQEYKNVPEGIITLAKKTVKLARQATNKDHVNYVNRNILAHASHEFLLQAQSQDLMLHELTYEARKHAHDQAHEKQLYVQEFENKYAALRKQAYEKTVKNNYAVTLQKYTIAHDTVMLLCKENLSPHEYENFSGTHLQHALMSETTESLDKLAILNACAQRFGQCGSFLQNTVSSLTLLAQAAKEFNDESDLTVSMLCLNSLESGIEVIAGGIQSVPLLAQDIAYMCEHPIDTAVSIAHFTKDVTLVLGQTARYCAFDRYFNPERAQEAYKNASLFLEGIGNYTYYSAQEASAQDYARIAAQQYLFLKAPGALLDATSALLQHTNMLEHAGNIANKAKRIVNTAAQPYLELASEVSDKIKLGISEVAELHVPELQYLKKIYSKIPETLEEYAQVLTEFCQKQVLDAEWYALESDLANYISQKYTRDVFPQDFLKLVPNFKNIKNPEQIINHLCKAEIRVENFLDINNIVKKLKMRGLHFDYKDSFEACSTFKFKVKNSYLYEQIHEFRNVLVTIQTSLGDFTNLKTFFPKTWTPYETFDFCFKHLKNAKIKEVGPEIIKLEVEIDSNLSLFYVFNRLTHNFETIFPKLKK